MDLSIVIVNYNVKHFLEQCLLSVYRTTGDITTEIIVVDNNSADGSSSMVLEKFRDVKLINNRENLGYSKANNQALEIVSGKYILLLNPDTVLDEESLSTCYDFMESHPDTGAVGLRMIDGKGKFLPESKRALPTPSVAFFKIFGLSKLFPGSKRCNKYYLGHLDKNRINKVEILTGAFMFIRNEALRKTGNLDEIFFMYGEDIDLSYRILQAGYNIYYLPSPPIIHYKGESTKRSDLNYVLHFYRSMILFARKHYSGKKAAGLMWLINIAICFRAALSITKRIATKTALPMFEGGLLYISFRATARAWGTIKYDSFFRYPDMINDIFIPVAVLIAIVSVAVWRGYSRSTKPRSLKWGTSTAAVVLLLVYSLLPLDLRFSRAVIIIWSVLIMVLLPIVRILLSFSDLAGIRGIRRKSNKIIIVSGEDEYDKILKILEHNNRRSKIVGRISTGVELEINSLGTLDQIYEVVRFNRPDEIIFGSRDLSTSKIISILEHPGLSAIEKRIACTDSDFVIGSRSGEKSGEVYTFSITGKK